MSFPLSSAAPGPLLISPPLLPAAFLKSCVELTGLLLSVQSMYMDQSHGGEYFRARPADACPRGRPSSAFEQAPPNGTSYTSLPAPSSTASLTSRQPRSSPLPQTQWSEIPLSYRPREWIDPNTGGPMSDPFQELPPRRPLPGTRVSSNSLPSFEQHQQRVRRSRGPDDRAHHPVDRPQSQAMDYSLLYPQMDPYNDRLGTRSARDHLESARSASQPASPSFWQLGHEGTNLPRSPTYPPSSRRRTRSSTNTNGAFDDPAEFHLFVQATAGLEPGPEFPSSQTSSSTSSQRHQQSLSEVTPSFRPSSPDYVVSPLEPETPASDRGHQRLHGLNPQRRRISRPRTTSFNSDSSATMQAYRHLATMPDNHSPPAPQRHSPAPTGIESWIAPPSLPYLDSLQILDPDLVVNDDEELPDYAASQAQAQAAHRMGAARRAAELQMRWLRSNR